mmetsp:Transcript_22121/g.68094  ORF Transcript_22121/g.68094 Transcript_22121/m.68094 type:complete len:121 (+) Transcript_22121:514-876(+)
MLRREDQLRRSDRVQAEMERAEESGSSDWIEVAVRVQEQVAEEFGLSKSEGVQLMRSKAPEHPELCHYVRYNRARRGDLRPGDAAPNVPVFHVRTGTTRGLFDDVAPAARRTLVLAGSYS